MRQIAKEIVAEALASKQKTLNLLENIGTCISKFRSHYLDVFSNAFFI